MGQDTERLLELKNGTRVHVRPIRPEDEPLLHESMLGLLRRLGWIHRAQFRGGVYEITFAPRSVEADQSSSS